ncbi:MAG: SIS domain-containing protein [Nitrospiraceae bacterium]
MGRPAAEKSGYPHFMLKEIHEQPQTILDTMRGRYSYDSGEADLPDIGLTPKACRGHTWTWPAVRVGMPAWSGSISPQETIPSPVQVDIGPEFRGYRDPLIEKNDLFVTISQSGETADTLAAAREAKEKAHVSCRSSMSWGGRTARESHGVLYTHCGLRDRCGSIPPSPASSRRSICSHSTLPRARHPHGGGRQGLARSARDFADLGQERARTGSRDSGDRQALL